VLVEALANYHMPLHDPRRFRPLAGGLLLVLLWLGLLSFTPRLWFISPVVSWTLVVATVAASVALRRMSVGALNQERAIAASVAPVART
jgi:predicted membrane channel-forming protein YqfA (hemolysin III family)